MNRKNCTERKNFTKNEQHTDGKQNKEEKKIEGGNSLNAVRSNKFFMNINCFVHSGYILY